jgi:hypothetical protein
MRFFRYIITDYTCKQHCGYVRSLVNPALFSPFVLIVAAAATVPWWVVSLGDPWRCPWYYVFNILAGELLLWIFAGLLSSILLISYSAKGTKVCPKCGATMFFAGRHFDPAGSARPHWSDLVIVAVFLGVNIFVWASSLVHA